jgi:hypothetical protein
VALYRFRLLDPQITILLQYCYDYNVLTTFYLLLGKIASHYNEAEKVDEFSLVITTSSEPRTLWCADTGVIHIFITSKSHRFTNDS